MTSLNRILCAGCLAAVLAPYVEAQMPLANGTLPSENTIESWLQSGDPRLEAWGARDALVVRDRGVIPDLLSLASSWLPISQQTSDTPPPSRLSSDQEDERDAMASVLDALIQMNVTVPADTLRTLAPDFGNAVAILLARLPDDESKPLSLDFFRSPPEHGFGLQSVSAALLALHPPFGFASDLLSSIRVHAVVYVIINPGPPAGGRGWSSSCGAFSDQPRPNWPVIGWYALSREKSDGAELVVAGIDPIYAARRQSARYRDDVCGDSSSMYLDPNERLRLIAEMLGVPPESMPWQTEVVKTIEFQTPQQFDDALLAFVEEQQEKYGETAYALADRGLATFDLRDSLPELELELDDMRGQTGDPLVKLLSLPPHVEWASSPW